MSSKAGELLFTKELICEQLVLLRTAAHPHIVIHAHFARIMGVSNAVVMAVINKKNLPQIDTIEKWTRACGKTVPEFFCDLVDATPWDIDIQAGYEDFYRLLSIIFKSPFRAFVAGIESNLAGLALTVNPSHPLTQRYAALLLRNAVTIVEQPAKKVQIQPEEGAVSARGSPGKKRGK